MVKTWSSTCSAAQFQASSCMDNKQLMLPRQRASNPAHFPPPAHQAHNDLAYVKSNFWSPVIWFICSLGAKIGTRWHIHIGTSRSADFGCCAVFAGLHPKALANHVWVCKAWPWAFEKKGRRLNLTCFIWRGLNLLDVIGTYWVYTSL